MTTQAVLAYLASAVELERRLGLMECREKNKPIYREMIGHDLRSAAPSVCAAIPELGYLDEHGCFADVMSGEVVPVAAVLGRYREVVERVMREETASQLVLATNAVRSDV